MALIPPFFLDTVVALGTVNEQGQTNWVGTGFLYGKFISKEGENKLYQVYLVTNKHVMNNLKTIVLRFNPQTNQAATDFEEHLFNPNGTSTWTGHTNPSVDVAVLSIDTKVLDERGLKYSFFCSDDHSLTINDMQTNGISEGDFLYVLGFPMGIVAEDRQHVILRQGVIARIRDLFEKRSTDFIIDALVFPGNSGGPIVLIPEMVSVHGTQANNKANLIGLIKSYIPYQDIAISQQTNKARVIFEENSGLSIAEPVDYILETIIEDQRIKKIT
jgi:S1-C subfamily serine protease